MCAITIQIYVLKSNHKYTGINKVNNFAASANWITEKCEG